METTPVKPRHHHTASAVTPQLLHRSSHEQITHSPTHGASQEPTKGCQGYDEGEEIQDKHTTLLN